MKLLYCGFNGFGQCPSMTDSVVSHLIELPLTSVKGAFVSWSCMAVMSGTGVYLLGFVGGRSHQLKQLTLPDSQDALQVSCSRGHALLLTPCGKCWRYCMKTGLWRRIDRFTMTERELEHKDTGTDPIVRVCCGSTFDVALSESGHAFVLPSPIYHPGVKVTQVACGNEHCLLLTETGQVFTWGRGSRGQLGHGDLESEQETARQVDSLAGLRVTQVAAGGWHSAAVTEWGDLYTWGWNHSGQLGFPIGENTVTCEHEQATGPKKLKTDDSQNTDEVTILNIPLPVACPLEQEVNVKDVGCGSRHTIVLLDDGTIWGCGWNAYGQLGMPPEQVLSSWKLTRLELPDGCSGTVTGIVCGAWSTGVYLK
ncbi:probable E3 ubiquitin-protein ligase HERC4 [Zootermopsis nevadensis]|uniref:RCC1 domain-containing protein 1 n=1 Tax=Zootermopsis nevadensis TaxID=136037 RepID=A0A067RE98_ZOONE|nr:probable E3 ubiquitin-protein ligase HERC4 [Zootermopsis nevadensis]XP_021914488.1 probable E3 ubiquitin-protein ligase HERC4 [Zootermopsis nevadensis]XP_021914489.1 probable E3 ubiquitin-protein ligase HERC4 [Zootermopsis nevadensis]XP_021914490.1 probable E3 ubiquitin-protein ligase HERC4 [Zootermopsis nevadensis]XP_021914492.1 probable E3 ubiquitin-protein ligase HERC4 [Zootermopsis nevadensis]XP_021914493.1 probable E3 ubiquitin-protein ligase HERC4 [Zootermopsis nevadensis]KDR22087.1 